MSNNSPNKPTRTEEEDTMSDPYPKYNTSRMMKHMCALFLPHGKQIMSLKDNQRPTWMC